MTNLECLRKKLLLQQYQWQLKLQLMRRTSLNLVEGKSKYKSRDILMTWHHSPNSRSMKLLSESVQIPVEMKIIQMINDDNICRFILL